MAHGTRKSRAELKRKQHGWTNGRLTADIYEARERIAELEAALRSLVADVDDYERVNNLAPSPGRLHSWQSMRNAKELLKIKT